jgi:hypothetical protein
MIEEKQEMKHMADIDDIDIEGDIPKNWPLTIIEQPPHSPFNSSLLEIDSGECFLTVNSFVLTPPLMQLH